MPLTALHPAYGVLDTTHDDLNAPVLWEDIHRVRPRPDLRCVACGEGVHAKVSPLGLRYFAHDPRSRADDCPVRHETVDHRILKNEIARAIRRAGWRADVEARGNGWRADVLARHPREERSMVWEVQLSPADVDEVVTRSRAYVDDGHEICWVTTRDKAAWLCAVPSILVAPGDLGGWVVRDGHRQLAAQPLADLQAVNTQDLDPDPNGLLGARSRAWLERTGQHGPWHDWAELLDRDASLLTPDPHDHVPRAEHFRCRIGWWRGRPVGLHKFIDAVQRDQVIAVELAPPHRDTSRPRSTTVAWTTRHYVDQALGYTAFALGWPVMHCDDVCPFPCPDCPCPRCGNTDQHVLNGSPLTRYHLCETCDPDLTNLALGIHQWEVDDIQQDPDHKPIGLTGNNPLCYHRPAR